MWIKPRPGEAVGAARRSRRLLVRAIICSGLLTASVVALSPSSAQAATSPMSETISPATAQDAVVGGPTYSPATTSFSGLPITLSIDATSSNVCVLGDDGSVSYIGAGTCTIDANQPGDADWTADEVQQSFTVGGGT